MTDNNTDNKTLFGTTSSVDSLSKASETESKPENKPETENKPEAVVPDRNPKTTLTDSNKATPESENEPTPATTSNPAVEHPSYYERNKTTVVNGQLQDKNIEPLDFIESILSNGNYSAFEGDMIGQIIPYLCRFTMKNGIEDLEKAQFYLNRLIAHEKALQSVNTK